ncbi:DNA modification methylase [Kaistia soli DSM 19436]|uniref:Methyltransferase n=1 Tax=Kaistia soli DSM 19436 TaxID=1122133 RepID=A0A1M5I273_9HYPH|nr:DNA methyltransferase [Kaistia soli]SHG22257.1 DNA modification methylase [Kaistia soli DSM 19436]
MSKRSIVDQPVAALKPRPGNPRTHSPKQVEQIAASIKRFGFTSPILIDDANGIIAGHGRVAAAKILGRVTVPTIKLSGMSEAEIRAYVIADNRLAEKAGWDRELLGIEFQYLASLDIDFDLSITGFELPEIDVLIGELSLDGKDSKPDPGDEVPAIVGPAITRAGDLWSIGRHRLICGDSTKTETYAALLGDDRAQMVFTDPPYNVPISGHVSGLGKVQHREFAMASGEMSPEAFTDFLTTVFRHLAAVSIDGAIHYQCMDWRHMQEVLAAGQAAYSELKNLCVWAKSNGGMGSLYRSQHELVFVFKSGTAPHINNVELGKHGRNRTNLWSYPGINAFGGNRDDLSLHPTVKPVALVTDAVLDCSRRKGIVLDAFAGSGTTLIAAERTGRCGYGIEIDPLYCDVILRRTKKVCRLDATLLATGQSFAEVEAERRAEANAADDTTRDDVVEATREAAE